MDFLRFTILSEVDKDPFSYTNKGGKTRLGQIYIDIPIDEDGNIDVNAQTKIANKYLSIQQCKQEIKAKLELLINQKVSF